MIFRSVLLLTLLASVARSDSCAKLCVADPDPTCKNKGWSFTDGSVCFGYFYQTEDRFTNYCFWIDGEETTCRPTSWPVPVEDAAILLRDIKRGALSPLFVPQMTEETIPALIAESFEVMATSDQVRIAQQVFNRVRDGVRNPVTPESGRRGVRRFIMARWFELGGEELHAVVKTTSPWDSMRDRILFRAYIELVTGMPFKKGSVDMFLRASGFRALCEEASDKILWLVKHDVTEWSERDLYSFPDAPFLRTPRLFELCPRIFAHDANARSVLYLDRLEQHLYADRATGESYNFHELRLQRTWLMKESFDYMAFNPIGARSQLMVEFAGESGRGYGIVKHWLSTLSERIAASFLVKSSKDEHVLLEEPVMKKRPNYLFEMEKIGTVLGLSFRERVPIRFRFPLSYYANIVGFPVLLDDIRDDDPVLFESYRKMLRFNLHEHPEYAEEMSFPNGETIKPTERNKRELIVRKLNDPLLSEFERRVLKKIRQGFLSVVPLSGSLNSDKLLTASVIRDVTYGVPLDVQQLKEKAVLTGFAPDSNQIVWLWRMIEGMDELEREDFLHFVTSSPKLPLGGIPSLELPITINAVEYREGLLPSTMTCVHLLNLPMYATEEQLVKSYQMAIRLALTLEE